MKNVLLLALLTGLYFPKKELSSKSTPCGVNEPLKELIWLKNEVARAREDLGTLTVVQAQYQGETIFSLDVMAGVDARRTTYYRCSGLVICRTSVTIAGLESDCGNISNELMARKTLYPNMEKK